MKGIGDRELLFNLIDKYNNIGSSSHPPAAAAASHPAQPEDFFRFPSSPGPPRSHVKRCLIAVYPEWGTVFSIGN
jgi:hypothetical protein